MRRTILGKMIGQYPRLVGLIAARPFPMKKETIDTRKMW
jgi:hypothetical protein